MCVGPQVGWACAGRAPAPSLALTLAPTSGSRPSEGPRVRVAASEGQTVSVSATQPCRRGKRGTDGDGEGGVVPRTLFSGSALSLAGPHRLHPFPLGDHPGEVQPARSPLHPQDV